ncbi:hypothetical protein GW17_00015466 [Ensete ventricosum]|nr:hypothetical protein GW17_00015466 [Ensete ventricosum]
MNGLRAGAQWGQSHVLKAAFRESGFVPPHSVAATEAHGRGPPAPPPAPVPPPFPPDSFTSSPPAQRSPKHPPASTLQDAVVGPASLRFGGMGGTRGCRGREEEGVVMGCAQSRVDNEEAVTRCKERRQWMKSAVAARNAFAAAHSAYAVALKNTGAALSEFGQGEAHDPGPSSSTATTAAAVPGTSGGVPPAVQPPIDPLPPPPPPLPEFSPSPIQRSISMPDLPKKFPSKAQPNASIREDDDEGEEEADEEEEEEEDRDGGLEHRRRPAGATAAASSPSPSPSPAPPPPPPQPSPPPPPPPMPESKALETWDYFFSSMDDNMQGPSLTPADEIRPARVDASEDRFKTSAPPPPVTDNHVVDGDDEPVTPEKVVLETPLPPKLPRKPKQGTHAHHQHAASAPALDAKRGKMVPVPRPSINLLKVLTDLDDLFLKASESTHEVSKMLEATRMHYHSNFADSRGTFDPFRELMKIEYQRKVALLNRQKKRGVSSEALERTKAAVSHLHTRYIVDMQSMDSTVSEIERLRDKQLYPKLVELVEGCEVYDFVLECSILLNTIFPLRMAQMWHSMYMHHHTQLKIVEDLKSLDITNSPRETSEHHHKQTLQLLEIAKEWHTQFNKLVSHQKEYVDSLNSWLKLTLIPIESSLKEKVSSPQRPAHAPIQSLLHAWHEYLEKLPDELAKSAIFSFSAVINTIVTLQQEEQKQKEKCEEAHKEYSKKNRAFDEWFQKYSQRRMGSSVGEPDGGEGSNQKDPVEERRFMVEALKSKFDEEVEAHRRLCKQVREKSLSSLKTHLPELFRAMSDFADACSKMYASLKMITEQDPPTN